VILAILVSTLFSGGKGPRWARLALGMLLLAGTAFSIDRYSMAYRFTSDNPAYDVGRYAATLAPHRVGMTSSGTAGFIAPNVINLDGKVNPLALSARKNDTLAAYLAHDSIEYVVDDDAMTHRLVAGHDSSYQLIGIVTGVPIYRRAMMEGRQ
jgi:hypothetical protein